ncbi:hypothetical protein UWK_01454 [Desulfocapsa sulfexigens DSM 10523]|uniref:Uncharacterized protein n=1 Tax=Desulfocapsa sulfexigens (strain DSM 10523 / SB164P1) TaxID=1167006 RepID=M1NEA2_DESSD|nr:hypothetical protein UWK_01454 [Desulfocapsa sulfexigens DSM 10523]
MPHENKNMVAIPENVRNMFYNLTFFDPFREGGYQEFKERRGIFLSIHLLT